MERDATTAIRASRSGKHVQIRLVQADDGVVLAVDALDRETNRISTLNITRRLKRIIRITKRRLVCLCKPTAQSHSQLFKTNARPKTANPNSSNCRASSLDCFLTLFLVAPSTLCALPNRSRLSHRRVLFFLFVF